MAMTILWMYKRKSVRFALTQLEMSILMFLFRL